MGPVGMEAESKKKHGLYIRSSRKFSDARITNRIVVVTNLKGCPAYMDVHMQSMSYVIP